MTNKLASLSIFFPAHNEEANINHLLEETFRVIPQLAHQFEIIVVNDGSLDETAKIVKTWQKKHRNLKLVNHPQNQGYGAALKSGFRAARFEWIFFTDADLQFDLQELADFVRYTNQYEVILGYRTNRAEGFRRAINAKLLKFFVDILFRIHVKDIDCAFKLFHRRVIQDLILESNGAFVSSEMLYKLKKNGLKFKQLPVNHYPRRWGNPTGANLKVILRAMGEAIQIYTQAKMDRLRNGRW